MRLRAGQVRVARRLARDAFVTASVVYVAILLFDVAGGGGDGHAYWLARLPDPYGVDAYGIPDGFYYSPVFAQAISPLTLLPWPVFHALFVALSLMSLYWLIGPWALPALFLPPVAIEVYAANIALPMAVVLVVGFRCPAAWAAVILTKVVPGIGILWFAVRSEWRSLAIVISATAAAALLSFALAPSLWLDWVATLRTSSAMPPATIYAALFIPRLVAAIAVVVFGARTGRAWLVPVATILAMPVVWPSTLCLLLAIPKLRGSWDPVRSTPQPAGITS